jgi:hypothetical protein
MENQPAFLFLQNRTNKNKLPAGRALWLKEKRFPPQA